MKTWVKWLVLGILSIVFGFIVLGNPVAASITVTMLAGIMFAVSGGFQMYAGFREAGGLARLQGIGLGILMLLLGFSLMFRPLQGLISLSMIVTILFAANGIVRLVTAWQMRDTRFFWPMLISGALTLFLAVYIIANFFSIAPALLGMLLGIELLFNGASLIALAFFLRAVKGVAKERVEAALK